MVLIENMAQLRTLKKITCNVKNHLKKPVVESLEWIMSNTFVPSVAKIKCNTVCQKFAEENSILNLPAFNIAAFDVQ